MRLASATISSLQLFSKLKGLSANARFEPGSKMTALQPFPTDVTSIRNPLYSRVVIVCFVWARQISPEALWIDRLDEAEGATPGFSA